MSRLERYFLAIIPPAQIQEEVKEIKCHFDEAYGCRAPLRSPAHITLQMPFRLKPEKEEKLIDSLTHFAQKQPAFRVALKDFGCFEPKVIFINVVKNEVVKALQKALVTYLRKSLGIFHADYKDQGFNPHITVAFRELKRPTFYQAWEEFREKSFQADFHVRSFWLLRHDGRKWQVQQEISLGH